MCIVPRPTYEGGVTLFQSSTPFSGQFRRQCVHFGNSAGNFGGSAVRRPVGYDSEAAMSKLVALLPNYMQTVQNWSEKGVVTSTYQIFTAARNAHAL